jgi:DNA-binding transcriptional ArsR family regulator
MYLETIYLLTNKNGKVRSIDVCEELGYSKPSVSRAIGILRKNEYTEVDKKGSGNYVTDGPFFYCENGKNKMIWSSFHEGRYVVLSAELDGIRGKIRHNGSLFDFDGGHAMIFNTLDGKRMISLHSPNKAGLERPHFFEF